MKTSSLTLRACTIVSAMMPALLNVRMTTVHGSLCCGEFKQLLLAEPDVEPIADVAVLEIPRGGVAYERDVVDAERLRQGQAERRQIGRAEDLDQFRPGRAEDDVREAAAGRHDDRAR